MKKWTNCACSQAIIVLARLEIVMLLPEVDG